MSLDSISAPVDLHARLRYLDSVYHPLSARTQADRARYWNAKAAIAELVFDFPGLEAALDSAAKSFGSEHDIVHLQEEYADWMHLKGVLYQERQEYDLAYQAFASARLIRNTLGLPCADFKYAERISTILYHQRRYDLALEFYKMTNLDVDVCYVPKDAFHVKQGALSNIGIAFHRSGRSDSALVYYEKALRYLDEMGPKYGIDTEMHHGVVYGNQAQALAALGRDEEAERVFLKSIELNMEPGHDISHAVLMMGRLVQFYLARGRFHEAKPWLDRIRPLIPLTTRNEIYPIWNEAMWQYHEGLGDVATAHRYLKVHKHLSDSMAAATAIMFKTDVLDAYNRLEYESRMSAIAQQRSIERGYLLVAVLGFFLMGGLALAVYRGWRSSRRHVHILESLNRKIDDQKAELQVLVEQLSHRDEEKNRILWMVAHDLRNPVGAVLSLAEFMEQGVPASEMPVYMRQIKGAANTSLALIRDILHAADSVSGNGDGTRLEKLDLVGVVAGAVDMVRFMATEKGQHLACHFPAEPVWVLMSTEQVARAVGNILANAIKFSPQNSSVDIGVRQDGRTATVEIRDRGIGIPEHLRGSMFSMFSGAKRPGTAGEQAFGLGLYITKHIMDRHGGQVGFECPAEGGTVFSLSFPVSDA